MLLHTLPHAALPGLALAIPLAYFLAGTLVTRDRLPLARTWRLTLWTAGAALSLALVLTGLMVTTDADHTALLALPGLPEALAPSLRLDALALAMLVLITFIGLIILRFSHNYLDGDPGQRRYQRWFLYTLTAVALLVIASQLLLFAGAWIASSLCLHQLLTYYGDRPRALLAARKKFITSRLGDIALLSAVALLYLQYQSLQLQVILSASEVTSLTTAAALLLAVAAILKCAQLPFHGWLTQVMEAPTPVSALLHAGIINMGGFLMIRFAPLLAPAFSAQILLVTVGGLTAAVATLVMMTRVSIKVMLAWSTCAQMGFMLMECGLGAYDLALLHLLAHSLYKAHSFLSAGTAVQQAGSATWHRSPGP